MKAIHIKTGSEHKVAEILGDRVVLESLKTGKTKMIDYSLFKQQYKLTDEDVQGPAGVPSVEVELEDANTRAEEVLAEANAEVTVVRISFDDEPKQSKPQKSKADKEPKKDKPTPQPKAPGSVVSLKDICDELKVDPSKARRVLRKATDIDKPGGKWEWTDPKTIAKIKSLLK